MATYVRGEQALPLLGAAFSFGLRIKSVRLFAGLTQAAFAECIGTSRSYLSEVESDKGKPSLEMVTGIAENFPEIAMGWLLNGKGEMMLGVRPNATVIHLRDVPYAGAAKRPTAKRRRRRKEPRSGSQ